MFKFYIYKFGQFCVNRLPRELSYRIAIFLSDLHYCFSFRDRKAVRNNLKAVLPDEKNISPLVREVFRNFGRYLVEFFRMAKEIDEDFIREKVEIRNIGCVKEALSRGKGAIVISAHIGNWEMGGVLLNMLGCPTTVIALPHKERPVNNLFNKQREAGGGAVIPTSFAIRRCLNILKNNGMVAVIADRDFSASGEVLDFLGRKALIPKGAAILSAKTGAPFIPVFLMREKDHTFSLTLEDPIYPSHECNGEIDQKTLLPLMKQHTAVIERKIRQYPTQWLMFRKFWIEPSEVKKP